MTEITAVEWLKKYYFLWLTNQARTFACLSKVSDEKTDRPTCASLGADVKSAFYSADRSPQRRMPGTAIKVIVICLEMPRRVLITRLVICG